MIDWFISHSFVGLFIFSYSFVPFFLFFISSTSLDSQATNHIIH